MAKIRIKGACENNLKNVDIEMADCLTVVTGVSGSGKSSLVFDTLYARFGERSCPCCGAAFSVLTRKMKSYMGMEPRTPFQPYASKRRRF